MESIPYSYRRYRQRPRRNRNALVLVAALACLLVVISLVGTMLQGALRTRRQLHSERDRRQTELLLQAGVERAVSRLAADPSYAGETWSLPASVVVNHGDARVITKVSTSDDGLQRSVSVVAEYPLGRDFPIRRSHTFQITSSTTTKQE